MADQCIVCLESLDHAITEVDSKFPQTGPESAEVAPTAFGNDSSIEHNELPIAIIQTCKHILHDDCLRDWTLKANSCPICRRAFHLVEVHDKVGGKSQTYHLPILTNSTHTILGNIISTYTVEDKKQVAEFDAQAWIDDQVEEFDVTPCPICDSADNEEVLLLCDACDAPYHTHCVGLDSVPHGHWFCMECVHEGANARSADTPVLHRPGRQPRTFAQRTQAQVRRANRRVASDNWHGAWNQISGRVWDALNLDLDYSDDDQSLASYRRHQRHAERERREFQQWQQRLRIAGRQGARDVFRDAVRPILTAREQPATPPKPTPQEEKAWEAFENAREADLNGSSSRKRKARSITRSPVEQSAEPERKLKRPKTRRVVNRPGSSSEASSSNRRNSNLPSSTTQGAEGNMRDSTNAPSFLSSLLKEVEMSTTTDDEGGQPLYGTSAASPSIEHSSPATSSYSTPRAMSITPPPYRVKRPGSPLPLTSRVEPIFPPADYSPNRSPLEHNHHSEGDRSGPISPPASEIRQPRPRRQQSPLPRSQEASPTRANMSIEAKEGISKIVRTALEPHYKKPAGITKEQYSNINRVVSHMLYEKIPDPGALDENEKSIWEKIATAEVTKAVESLGA
jgi:hypothetical protein